MISPEEEASSTVLLSETRPFFMMLFANFFPFCSYNLLTSLHKIPSDRSGLYLKIISSHTAGTQPLALQRNGSGFFAEHGRPETAIVDSKVVTFWPDEWKSVLGDENAVGNFIQVYIPPSDGSSSLSWRRGRVLEYIAAEGMHRISLDSPEGSSGSAALSAESSGVVSAAARQSDQSVSVSVSVSGDHSASAGQSVVWESKDVVKLIINDCKHVWYDNGQRQKNLTGKKTPNIQSQLLFDYSQKDVGKFCRVWWTRYKCFYYARVVSYNTATKEHHVIYEDGDKNSYDMSTKLYETIQLPLSFSFSGAKNDADCAHLVSTWHAKTLSKQLETDAAAAEAPARAVSSPEIANSDVAAVRPVASLAQGASAYHFAVINTYFAEVGVLLCNLKHHTNLV